MTSSVGYVVYDAQGCIKRSGVCPLDDLANQGGDGETVLQDAPRSGRDYYVTGGVVTARGDQSVTVGSTNRTAGLIDTITAPAGAEIFKDGISAGTATAGSLDVTWDRAGLVEIRSVLWPNKDFIEYIDISEA